MSAVVVGDYLLQIKDGINLQPCHTHLCLCVCERVNVGKQAAGSDNAVADTGSAGGPASLCFWQNWKTHFQV